jgi:crotonobetainyl-CoA:carnitine CoA-transferase CaiB-like acyl-CoA transferase
MTDAVVHPLDGINVLEIAHYIAGPFATMILADQGATVTKIEPLGGEPGRHAYPKTGSGESLYFASYNRGKRSIRVDLRSAEARPVLEELIKKADVLVTNFSQGVPERLGFGWETAKSLNPRLVMVHITGFGSWSAVSDYLAYDPIIQVMSGVTDMTGEPGNPPSLSGVMLGDHVTAIQAASAASSGLHLRERTGEGNFVEVSMMRSLAALLGDLVPQAATLGGKPTRHGNRNPLRFGGMYETNDGHVMIAPIAPPMWRRFCEEIGQPQWGDEEIALSRRNVFDREFRDEVERVTRAWMSQHTTDHILTSFQTNGIPCGAVRSVAEVCESDIELELRMFEDVDLADGSSARVVGRSFDWEDGRGTAKRICDDESEEVLASLGVEPERIRELVDSRVVGSRSAEGTGRL